MFSISAPIGNASYTDTHGLFVEPPRTKKVYSLYAKVVRRRSDISDGAKLTYLEILDFDFAHKYTGECKGYVFPSNETLSENRGVSERTIRQHIEELIVAGVLSRVRRKNKSSLLYISSVIQSNVEQYTSESRTAKKSRSQSPLSSTKPSEKTQPETRNQERQKSAVSYIDENTRILETTTNENDVVAQKLERLKLSPEKARSLAEGYPQEHIEKQIAELERRIREGQRPIRNPAGWLITAIEVVEVEQKQTKPPTQLRPVCNDEGEITHFEAYEFAEEQC
jgi:hypothetical protein